MAPMLVLLVAVALCVCSVHASGSNHKYGPGDPVPLYANKVGPFHNPRSALLVLFLQPLVLFFEIGEFLCFSCVRENL